MRRQDNAWESFARKDPEFYISTRAASSAADARSFFASGRRDANLILAETSPWLRQRGAAVDIGAGVGRVALAMAERFDEVVAVDISPAMLAKLRERCRRERRSNVRPFLSDAPWQDQVAADLVYSTHVFQHIADEGDIKRYLVRIRRCLMPAGVAYLHFDTRPGSALYSVRNRVPDALLPRLWRHGIRRVPRPRARLLELFEATGLRVVREARRDTAFQVFVVVPERARP